MSFPRKVRRPVLAILGGVFLIGAAVVRSLVMPPAQTGSLPTEHSEAIVPTPMLMADLVTPSPVMVETQTAIQLAKSTQVTGQPDIPSENRRNRENYASFGEEPKAAPLVERINAAGKEFPVWLSIPAIGLNAPVVPATQRKVIMDGKIVDMWFAPDLEAAGWHSSSALPGEVGNLVFSGHNNDFGQVFTRLIDLKPGDLIQLVTQKRTHNYRVSNKVLFQEVEIDLSQRMENARWISPSTDERITLVTCWPYDSNTHRLVIVASPE